MANRLSENHNWKVLLLEIGDEETDILTDVPLTAAVTVLTSMYFSRDISKDTQSEFNIIFGIFFLQFVQGHNWGYRTEKEKNACLYLEGGVCHWPKGKAHSKCFFFLLFRVVS